MQSSYIRECILLELMKRIFSSTNLLTSDSLENLDMLPSKFYGQCENRHLWQCLKYVFKIKLISFIRHYIFVLSIK